MKNLVPRIINTCFFFSVILGVLPQASAQGWQWGRAGLGCFMEAWAVTVDAAGNSFGSGSNTGPATPVIFGSVSVPMQSPQQAVWVKYDPSGNVVWAGGTTSGNNAPQNICTDPYGNLIVFGISASASMQLGPFLLNNPYYGGYPFAQYFIAKISPTGTVLWVTGVPPIDGGRVTTDSVGNIYITSAFTGKIFHIGPYTFTNADPTGNTDDILVAKYSPLGNLLWASSIGGSGQDFSLGITVSSTGCLYISGEFNSPALIVGSSVITNTNSSSYNNALIAKFSLSGTPIWAESGFGLNGNTGTIALGHDNSGNVYMTGDFTSSSISFGATTITRTYPNAPSTCIYVVKYSPADVVTWSKKIESPLQGVEARSLAVSPCNKVWVSGYYFDNAIMDPGDTIHYSPGRDPVFFARYDLSGGPGMSTSLSCGGDDEGEIVCDGTGNLLFCGDFSGSQAYPTLQVGPDILNPGVNGPEFIFVAKYGVSPDSTYTHQDTTTCAGSGLILTGPAGYSSYYWDDTSSARTRKVTKAGKYLVYCMKCDSVLVDTFNVMKTVPDISYKDTNVCTVSDTALLYAPVGYTTYLWNTSDTASSVAVTSNNTYWVYADSSCSELIDTFKVKTANIAFSLGSDSSACAPVILHAPPFADTHTWQDGANSSTYTAGTSGVYSLAISSQGCNYADTITLHITDVSQHLSDTVLCREQPVQLTMQANVPPGGSIVWSDSSKFSTLYIKDTGIYWLTVSDSMCTGSDTFKVVTEFCDCSAYIPNAFTPNSDGKNDFFRPIIEPGCRISEYWFAIYNRWGQQVFFSKTPGEGWDGHFNGAYCEIGSYEWLFKYTGGVKNGKHLIKGDMLLLR